MAHAARRIGAAAKQREQAKEDKGASWKWRSFACRYLPSASVHSSSRMRQSHC